MFFKAPLIQGKLIKRYKRFFADVDLSDYFNQNKIKSDSNIVVAHVPNTGSLKSCSEPGSLCYVSPADNPERKLKYTLELVQAEGKALVGVNTAHPNHLVLEAYQNKVIPHWEQFDEAKAEVKINAETRLDLMLIDTKKNKKHYIEIKNVTLKNQDAAQFPDAETTRGQKHLKTLMDLIEQGHSAEICFVIQRNDCSYFTAAKEVDPVYAKLLLEAQKKGVLVTPLVVDISTTELKIKGRTLEFRP